MSGIILWDDSLSQSFELELFERDDRIRVAFRVWHVERPERVRTQSGRRTLQRGRRTTSASPDNHDDNNDGMRCFLEGESSFRLDELSRGADQLAAVATFLLTRGSLEPLGREFRLQAQRNVFVPQVRISVTVDGNVYLPHPPVVPGHSELTLRFWATDDELLAFAEALDDETVALGATSRWQARQPAKPSTVSRQARQAQRGKADASKRPASPLSPLGLEPTHEEETFERSFFWEENEESLNNEEELQRQEEEWERLNEEWLKSHMRERTRRPAKEDAEEEADTEDAAAQKDKAAQEQLGGPPAAEPFVVMPVADELGGGYPERDPELPRPSEEAEALSAIRDAKEGGAAWLELEDEETRRLVRAKPHVDTRTGLVWPGTFDPTTLDIPSEEKAKAKQPDEPPVTDEAAEPPAVASKTAEPTQAATDEAAEPTPATDEAAEPTPAAVSEAAEPTQPQPPEAGDPDAPSHPAPAEPAASSEATEIRD